MPIDAMRIFGELEIALPPESAHDIENASQTALHGARQELTENRTASHSHALQTGYDLHIKAVCKQLDIFARQAASGIGAHVSPHEWQQTADAPLARDGYKNLHPLAQYGVKELLFFLYQTQTQLGNEGRFSDLLAVYVRSFTEHPTKFEMSSLIMFCKLQQTFWSPRVIVSRIVSPFSLPCCHERGKRDADGSVTIRLADAARWIHCCRHFHNDVYHTSPDKGLTTDRGT